MESLWKRGLKALVWAVVANLVVWWLGVSLLTIPSEFPPLAGAAPTVFFTTVGAVGAVLVFALLRRVSDRPALVFRRVAVVFLLLSFIPDLLLLTEGGRDAVPGVTVPGVAVLMIMHVVAAVIIIRALAGDGAVTEEA